MFDNLSPLAFIIIGYSKKVIILFILRAAAREGGGSNRFTGITFGGVSAAICKQTKRKWERKRK